MPDTIFFYIRENCLPISLNDYSGQEVAALEEGVQRLLDHSDETDNYFNVDCYDEDDSGWGRVTYNECVKGDKLVFPKAWIDKYTGRWWMLNDPKEMSPLLHQYGVNPWKFTVEVCFTLTQELPKLLPPPTGLERCVAAPSGGNRSPVSLIGSPIPENDSLRTELKKYMHRLAKRMGELEGKPDQKDEYELCKKCWHHANQLLLEL
jgi:hypothetical protein